MFEFEEYCFIMSIKRKFKFWNFLSENSKFSIFNWSKLLLDRLIEIVRKSILEFACFNQCLIPIRSTEKSIRSIKRNYWPVETRKTEFSAKFFGNCSECLMMFQALWTVLWNILTLHTCLLMKNNPIGINRRLCLLEKIYKKNKK